MVEAGIIPNRCSYQVLLDGEQPPIRGTVVLAWLMESEVRLGSS